MIHHLHVHVVKHDWPITTTLEDVEVFRQCYVRHYNLRDCAMMLNSIRPGTFTVTWVVPSSVVELLKKRAPKVFREFNVSRLEFPGIAGCCVYEAPFQLNVRDYWTSKFTNKTHALANNAHVHFPQKMADCTYGAVLDLSNGAVSENPPQIV